MTGYAAAGTVAVIAAALAGLSWLSYRAGSKTQAVAQNAADDAAQAAVGVAQARMGTVVAAGAADQGDIIQRLEAGRA